nr:DUF3737 family protein [Clostridia bacterium]
LYNLTNGFVDNCIFAGPEDGESALKEAKDIEVVNTKFYLRYPLWHVDRFKLDNIEMFDTTRAALWYDTDGIIENSNLGGIKALRECKNITIKNTSINSAEFGWKCNNIKMYDSSITSEYLFFNTNDIEIDNIKMKGKYSFQYVNNLEINNSNFDTKDAFWHSKNVTVKNSTIKGEYLAWFAEDITFINCKIIGTQPLCYCKNLKLINCTMEDCDLSFEYSEVDADIVGSITSVKNPKSGTIIADDYGEIILENSIMDCKASIKKR